MKQDTMTGVGLYISTNFPAFKQSCGHESIDFWDHEMQMNAPQSVPVGTLALCCIGQCRSEFTMCT